MRHKNPRPKARKHVPQTHQVTQVKNGHSYCTNEVTSVHAPIMSLSAGLSAPGCRYYFNWDGLGLSLIYGPDMSALT